MTFICFLRLQYAVQYVVLTGYGGGGGINKIKVRLAYGWNIFIFVNKSHPGKWFKVEPNLSHKAGQIAAEKSLRVTGSIPPPPHPLSSHHGSSPLPLPLPLPPHRIPTSRFYRVVIHSAITRCAVLAQRVGWIMLQQYCSIFCWKPSFYAFISMETLHCKENPSYVFLFWE